MTFEDEATELIEAVSVAVEATATTMAGAYYTQYEAFIEAGFTEEQAMTLLTELDMGLEQ